MLARDKASRVDEAALIERVLRRDEQAWRELVRASEPTLRALIQENEELSASDVDDVIGELWLRMLDDDRRRLRRFAATRPASLDAWLAMQASQVAHAFVARRGPTLVAALKRLSVVRAGFVLRDIDGAQLSDGVCCKQIRRICRRAGLPERGWHVLRHSFGTHAAMFGVNPWKLMTWMGHKRIDETMLYVNFAGNHLRQLPRELITAPGTELDPDRRIVAMLGARGTVVALEGGVEKEVERLRELN